MREPRDVATLRALSVAEHVRAGTSLAPCCLPSRSFRYARARLDRQFFVAVRSERDASGARQDRADDAAARVRVRPPRASLRAVPTVRCCSQALR